MREYYTNNPKDKIFASDNPPDIFSFDSKVALVFDDMISRSVPFYCENLELIKRLVLENYDDKSKIYDLGCSTGTLINLLAGSLSAQQKYGSFVGVDSSYDMLNQAEIKLKPWLSEHEIILRDQYVQETDLSNAGIIVLSYTLQFIPVDQRQKLLLRIYKSLQPGGIFIISEKINIPSLQGLVNEKYNTFKESNGYSLTEIAKKRAALENVLVPTTHDNLQNIITKAGFKSVQPILQWYNFVTMVMRK